MWPFRRSAPPAEVRGFTDLLVEGSLAMAEGSADAASRTAAVEAVATLYGFAFASVAVEAEGAAAQALDAPTLSSIARSVIRQGESLHLIRVNASGRVELAEVGQWEVVGSDPDAWRYLITRETPAGGAQRRSVAREGVIHCLWRRDPSRPWRGVSALAGASDGAAFLGAVEKRLREESSAPSALVVPMPLDPAANDSGEGRFAAIKDSLRSAKGRAVFVRSTADGYEGAGAKPSGEWQQKRIGATLQAEMLDARRQAAEAIYCAFGVPVALMSADAEGTASREAWRRFLHGALMPLGRIVAVELSAKLDARIEFDWQALAASDLAGRARAFGSMVKGGLDVADAAAISGLLSEDDSP